MKKVSQTQPSYEETAEKFSQMIMDSRELVQEDKVLFDYWEKSLFAVCAWIDEQILLSDWKEKEVWQLNPLQKQYFQTTQAGEKFFEVLECFDIVRESQIIEVYNFCIKLGFQGKHFKPANKNQLAETNNNSKRYAIDYISSGVSTLFSNGYKGDQAPRKTKKKLRIGLELVIFLTAAGSVLCLALLGTLYNMLLNGQISRYFK